MVRGMSIGALALAVWLTGGLAQADEKARKASEDAAHDARAHQGQESIADEVADEAAEPDGPAAINRADDCDLELR